MFRVILVHVVLFLLPFIGYAVWLWLAKRSKDPDNWTVKPVAWLTVAGLVLVIGGLVGMASFDHAPEGASWRPSEMRDGVFVPGRYE